MTPKLFKAAEVCDMAQVQPYVLRSWEKEFPGIGVEKTSDGPRLYRQSDIDQVLKIKQLVFGEGLTLAGARRRLEGASGGSGLGAAGGVAVTQAGAAGQASGGQPVTPRAEQPALFEPPAARFEQRPGETDERLTTVRDGLRSILTLLSSERQHDAQEAAVPTSPPRAVRPRKRATA